MTSCCQEADNGCQARDTASGAASVVRSFGERRGSLGSTVLSSPLTAPYQIMDILLADPLIRVEGGPLQTSPETVVVGPGSRRIQIYISGEIHLFNILPSRRRSTG